jgi:predicted aldo/keto reductase-like oxidoreductase
MLPIVGYGGWDCVVNKTDAEGIAMMHEAADSGFTFFDNAWEYNEGRSEVLMGKAFESPSRREKIFLMTKVCARDYAGFQKQFHESLKRLRTDHVDLLQFHAIQYEDDPKRIFDPEKGALKGALEAKKAGKLRFLGFSGHMYPEKHLEMIGMPHPWDTVQMPLNIMDAHYKSFQKQVLPEARKRGIGVLGMKSLAGQDARIPRDLKVSVELCRRYAMSLPVTTTICGMQTPAELRQMLEIARGFKPLTAEAVEELLKVSREPAQDGHIEVYKDRASGYGCSYHDKVLRSSL